MTRQIQVDLVTLSKLAGLGDGVADVDALGLAINAITSLERRLWTLANAAEGEGCGVARQLHCERERFEALAAVLMQLRDEQKSETEVGHA